MWKFLGKKFGRHHGPSSSLAQGDSSADISGKFTLEKHCTHGFPLAPSCMTFDIHRRVIFIGTSCGELRMLGLPGIELTGLHDDASKVLQILPFASEPSLITICSNNIMHKWSLVDSEGNTRLVLRRTYKFQGGLAKTITMCCLPPHCDCLFVGTLGGITYPMDTEFDGMSPEVLSWSRARAYLKYNGKDVPGEVRTLQINPVNPKQLLIGYLHNYLELWDALTWKPISFFGVFKQDGIEDILSSAWHPGGNQFITAHQDGSLAFWSVDSFSQPVKIQKPYGDENVLEMSDVLWPDDDLLIVSGGSPLSLIDGHCLTILDHDRKHTVQLSSHVKGMHILDGVQGDKDSGIVNYGESIDGEGTNQRVLILLLEQEILFIEVTLPELPLLRPPYLYSIHNSPVKCSAIHIDISKDVWQTIFQTGRVQQDAVYGAKSKVWPIDGGILDRGLADNKDVLITGHEDGTIKFWDIRSMSMQLLYVLKSSPFFNSFDSEFHGETPENENSNVHQICFWDPRSDDDQIQVSCLKFFGDQLVVGFMGGSVLLFNLNNQLSTLVIPLHRVSILRDDPRQRGRNWQAPMELRLDGIECAPGYQPIYCVGIFPNIPITAIGLAKDQKLLGVGCMYGFTVVDYQNNTTVHISSTFNELANGEDHLSRMQSIRKSFRQSLKRLNVRRSMRGGQSIQRSFRPTLVRSGSTRPSMKHRAGVSGIGASPGTSNEGTPMPPRRDSIRSIVFAAPCQLAGSSFSPCLIVGTNQGGVLCYNIDMPSSKYRDSKSPIVMPIEREFNIKRNHAVVFCGVLDHQNYLLDINDPNSYHHSSTKGGQWLVVVTEDCIKVLGLPNLKKKFRVRLKHNDNDEYHVQSGHILRIGAQSYLLLMGSDGFVSLYSLPELKLICKEDCVDASDAVGQRNFVISPQGLLLHQSSPSEFTRGSISEHARMEFSFSLPYKNISKLVLAPNTPKTINKEPISELLPTNEHEVGAEESTDHPVESKENELEEASLEDTSNEHHDFNGHDDQNKEDFQERAL